jgi:TetR/AcrR family transcriptional regulator, transcriptional repressor for nem operon
MRKGERTREAILQRAVTLFNRKGYTGVSLADIMEATGLQKGGIYNHFESKEALAVEAFDYGFKLTGRALFESLRGQTKPIDRLKGFIRFFEGYYRNPPLTGGCILLNTAIDADDSNPALRERAQRAMDVWRELLLRTTERGIAQGQIREGIAPELLVTVIISTLEGAIMMSKLYDDGRHIDYAVDHLLTFVEENVQTGR